MAKSKASRAIEVILKIHYFPHQLSFLIDNPLRKLLISPATLVKRLALFPEARVLELGAGSGFFSLAIAQAIRLGQLDVFDLQPEMLVKARRKLEAAQLFNISYTQGDACALPFPSETFDVAVLVAVIGEVPDQQKCLQSLWRVLRPGGIIAFHEHLPDPDLIRPETLQTMVESEGFVFQKRFGSWWNYTSIFTKPS